MNAAPADLSKRAPRWRRTLSVIRRRSRYMPAVELLTLLGAVAVTYLVVCYALSMVGRVLYARFAVRT